MDDMERQRRLNEEPDFICIKRFDYSLAKLLARYPDEIPEFVVAQALGLDEADVERRYTEIVGKLRGLMKVE